MEKEIEDKIKAEAQIEYPMPQPGSAMQGGPPSRRQNAFIAGAKRGYEIREEEGGWIEIKVGGEMPKGEVLGYSNQGKIRITWPDGDRGTFDDYPLTSPDDYFTHWQPLPKPPSPPNNG